MSVMLKTALRGSTSEYTFAPPLTMNKDLDIATAWFFNVAKAFIKKYVRKNKIFHFFCIKVSISFCVHLEKFSFELDRIIIHKPWFVSGMNPIFTKQEIITKIKGCLLQAQGTFDAFVEGGSGWYLRNVLEFRLKIAKFRPFRGGCLTSPLPQRLGTRKALINLKHDNKQKCFLYAVAACLEKKRKNPNRVHSYNKIVDSLPHQFLTFPVSRTDIARFEKVSGVAVYVYAFEKTIVPYYKSSLPPGSAKKAHLFFHKEHYYPIRSMSAFVCGHLRSSRAKTFICDFCLTSFNDEERLKKHCFYCLKNLQHYKMPKKPQNIIDFKAYASLVPAPFVIYADLESLCLPEEKSREGGVKTLATASHIPISICSITHCRVADKFSSKPFIYTGEDCISVFFKHLEAEFSRIQNILSNIYVPLKWDVKDKKKFEEATKCYMCSCPFDETIPDRRKRRDHCHLSGSYRWALCDRCNLSHAATKQDVFVFFHGLSNYDSHFLVQHLGNYKEERIKIIERGTAERFLTFSIGGIHFKDSCQFLQESLANLVSNLATKGKQYFHCVNKHIKGDVKRSLFNGKGIFPYSYMTSCTKLKEKQLPPIEAFFNVLNERSLTQKDYIFAQKVWAEFNCRTLQDYMETYLLADVLLLCDVFENFRNNCLSLYDLDPVNYFSSPHFTFDAFFRFCKGQSLELLTDIDHHLLFQRGVRGGVSMITQRLSEANNRYMANFDKTKEEKYILYLDCTNLYGYAMTQYLPSGSFEWLDNTSLDYVFSLLKELEEKSEFGYLFEVDLDYPSYLHDEHADYPLAPLKEKIPYSRLSPYARSLCDNLDLKHSLNQEKLLSTLENKKHYVIHYRCLQLYLSLGMKLKYVHAGIKFKQKPIMKDYIEFNARERAIATNPFDVAFYKLLCNSLYGKALQRLDRKTKTEIVTNEERFLKFSSKPTFKNVKVLNPSLATVSLNCASITINKPSYLGTCILDLAKYKMFDFHYNIIKKHFASRAKLLFTDTDSLMYEITSDDVYKELLLLKDHFDFSNYPPGHELFSLENKRVPGKFKDESGGKIIKKFIGLKSKMYAFEMDNTNLSPVKAAKGVKKYIIENSLRLEDYENCLKKNQVKENKFRTIRSQAHKVTTSLMKKVSLSPFDDKRFLLNAVKSLPYGHYTLREENKL